MGISHRMMKGSVWLAGARIVVNILASLSLFIMAWSLTPADFGLVALGTTFMLIVTSVTELSLNQALVRHDNPDDDRLNAAFSLNALRGLMIWLLFILCAYPIALFYDDMRLVSVMIALGFSVFIGSLGNPRRVILQRDLVFHQEFLILVAQKMAGFIVGVGMATLFRTYWALVFSMLVSQSTIVILSYALMPYRPRLSFRHMRELLSFSLWLSASQIVNTLNWRFDFLLVGKMLGAVPLGHYSVGGNLAMMPTREATIPLTQTIFPGFSAIKDDRPRLVSAYQRVQALVSAIALPAGIGTALIADPLVRVMLGEKWLPVVFIVQALSCVYGLQTLGSIVQPLGMAMDRTRTLFMRDLQMLLLRVPLLAAAAYAYGLTGLVIARVVTGLLSAFVNMVLVRRFIDLPVRHQIGANMRSLIGVLVMSGCLLALQYAWPVSEGKVALIIYIIVNMMVGGLVYGGTMFGLWALASRPGGPEWEILQMLNKVLAGRGVKASVPVG
ncbi:lipopolysaccharide biosynthesis protein [Sphingobium sp.]|uniref:lipopolysaccharide biosynthesis protein n=1 Tax=Sphingobium sp. TaxID=1912891 RepID=UPI003B3ADCD0